MSKVRPQRSAGDQRPGQGGAPASGTGRRSRNRLLLFSVLGVLALVLAIIVGMVVFYAKAATDALNSVQRAPSLMPTTSAGRPPEATAKPGRPAPMNVLIMGSDSRGAVGQGRSDVLMMAHVTGDRKNVYLISFPRDMWVDVPGHGKAKINAAYAWGGVPLTIRTVEHLTGARIEHVSVTDFEGFTAAIDAIGGIDLYNPDASASGSHTFPKGTIHLDGAAALVYTRERYNLPNGDLDRARRQRDVVMAVVRQVITPAVLANPGTFSQVLTLLAPHFTVDDQFTDEAITRLALSMRITSGGAIRSMQAPLAGFGTSADGQSIDLVHAAHMADLGEALRTDTMQAYYEAHKNDPPAGR